MIVKKAVITAAGPDQTQLPLQTLINRHGEPRSTLQVQLAELVDTGIETVGIVIGAHQEEAPLVRAAGDIGLKLKFIRQAEDKPGFGHAVLAAKRFAAGEAFLLMVGDHMFISDDPEASCAAQLLAVARREDCLVSAVQATHESQLGQFGTIGGRLLAARDGLFEVTRVIEKPSPTLAEQELLVPGQRLAHYLCFFGMHVIPPMLLEVLEAQAKTARESGATLGLSPALDAAVGKGKYLAARLNGRRFDLEQRYGILKAQIAIGLQGREREELLTGIIELLAPVKP